MNSSGKDPGKDLDHPGHPGHPDRDDITWDSGRRRLPRRGGTPDDDRTVRLSGTPDDDRTVRLSGTPRLTDGTADPPAEGVNELTYSATALDNAWGLPTVPEQDATRPMPTVDPAAAPAADPATVRTPPVSGVPDAPDQPPPGGVLRFGPGVPPLPPGSTSGGTLAGAWHGDVREPPRPPRPRRLRRYGPALVILLAVAVFLLWQQRGPDFAVTAVDVTAGQPAGCDSTTDVVATVRTNGRPGTIRYQWFRSDGSSSDRLERSVERGRREVKLHLHWTFRGAGTVEAEAELRITSPTRHTATAAFTYTC